MPLLYFILHCEYGHNIIILHCEYGHVNSFYKESYLPCYFCKILDRRPRLSCDIIEGILCLDEATAY